MGIISLGTNDAKTANLASGESDNFVAEYKSLITNIVEDLWDVGSDLKQLVLCSAVPIAGLPIDQVNREEWDESSQMWVGGALRDDMMLCVWWPELVKTHEPREREVAEATDMPKDGDNMEPDTDT